MGSVPDEEDAPRAKRKRAGPGIGPPLATEVITFSRPPGLSGVEIMAADNSPRLCRVYHETYTVCTLFDAGGGGAEWAYRSRLHSAGAGELMLMEPGELHATKRIYGGGGTYRVVMVATEVIRDLVDDVGTDGSLPHFGLAASDCPELFGSFARFHSSVESGAAVFEQECRLAGCLRQVLERCAERPPCAPPAGSALALARMRDLINDAYGRDIRLEDLAQAAGMSRYHLCRAFANQYGLPPHAYLLRVRVARAMVLLSRGMNPVEVAFLTGFCDQSHLGRQFRAVLGVTPRRYEQMVGARSS